MEDRFIKVTGFFQRMAQDQVALCPPGVKRKTFLKRNNRLHLIAGSNHGLPNRELKIGIVGHQPERRLQFLQRFRTPSFPQRNSQIEPGQWIVTRNGEGTAEKCFAICPETDLPASNRSAKEKDNDRSNSEFPASPVPSASQIVSAPDQQ